MLELKKYEAIQVAKSAIMEFCAESDQFDCWEYAIPVIRSLMNMRIPILQKQAFLTVIESGTFIEGNGFNLPATSCCCENFKQVCRDLKKKRQVYIWVYDPDDERADSEGYFAVGIF